MTKSVLGRKGRRICISVLGGRGSGLLGSSFPGGLAKLRAVRGASVLSCQIGVDIQGLIEPGAEKGIRSPGVTRTVKSHSGT